LLPSLLALVATLKAELDYIFHMHAMV
jgi:hypothetical protein